MRLFGISTDITGVNRKRSLTELFRLLFLMFFIMTVSVNLNALQIKQDESIIFYPTVASFDSKSTMWDVPIHGHVFDKEEDSLFRKNMIASLKKDFNVTDKKMSETFNARLSWFMVDNQGWKQIDIMMGSKVLTLNNTSMNGHAEQIFKISDFDMRKILSNQKDPGRIHFKAKLSAGDKREFSGIVFLPPKNNVFLISDIDDTVKVSDVRNKKELVKNTFLVPFTSVSGMSQLCRSIVDEGSVLCFVSASPWQLYSELSQFLVKDGFPDGVYCLKYVRLKDSSLSNIFMKGKEFKISTIEPMIRRFPNACFIFMGDSGEQDPEAYGVLASRYPKNVVKILIRKAYDEDDALRYSKAFKDVPREKWRIFKNPEEVKSIVGEL